MSHQIRLWTQGYDLLLGSVPSTSTVLRPCRTRSPHRFLPVPLPPISYRTHQPSDYQPAIDRQARVVHEGISHSSGVREHETGGCKDRLRVLTFWRTIQPVRIACVSPDSVGSIDFNRLSRSIMTSARRSRHASSDSATVPCLAPSLRFRASASRYASSTSLVI